MRDLATHQFFEEANGRPRLLATQTLTSSSTSYTSAAIPAMSRLLVQCSAAVYLKVGDSTVSLSGTAGYALGGVYLASNEKYYLCLKGTDTNLAFNSATSGAVVNIFIME